MSIYLPIWTIVAIVGGVLWYMNNRWLAVGTWFVSALLAGFVHVKVLEPVVNTVKNWIA